MKYKALWIVIVGLFLMQFSFCDCAEIHGVWEVKNRYPVKIKLMSNSSENVLLQTETIHTNCALAEQYDSETAKLILYAQGKYCPQMAADSWPTVSEIVQFFDPVSGGEVLDDLEQLTILQDIKYTMNGNHVQNTDLIDGASIQQHEMHVEKYEAIRFARNQDFVILQFDLENHCVYQLTMKDYDSHTGAFTVEFPCVGPFMITQRIKGVEAQTVSGGTLGALDTVVTDLPGHGSISTLEKKKQTVIRKQDPHGEWYTLDGVDDIYTSEAE